MPRPMSSLLESSLLGSSLFGSSPLGRTRGAAATPIDQPEAQRAGDWRRLDEFDRDRIAKAVGRGAADESATGFVKTKVLLADAARRNKTVGAGVVELDEQPGACHPGNMPVENCTDTIGQEVRNQPIGGLAFGLHGAAFGCGNISRNFGKASRVGSIRQSIHAELERADQRAMDDEIGVATDRRGKMGIA